MRRFLYPWVLFLPMLGGIILGHFAGNTAPPVCPPAAGYCGHVPVPPPVLVTPHPTQPPTCPPGARNCAPAPVPSPVKH